MDADDDANPKRSKNPILIDAQTWFAKELLAQVMFIVVLAKLIKISLNVFSSERGSRF